MYKKFIYLLVALAFFTQGCEDLLEEDFRSGNATEDFYNTVNGIEALVAGTYVSSKIWYGKEEGYDFSAVGTDMYTYAQQHPYPELFTFSPSFNANSPRIIVIYVEYYKGINACNEALFYLEQDGHPMNDDLRLKRQAEVRFLRAFYLWHLVDTFGPIAMPLKHTTEPVVNASRTPVNEVYDQIFADLEFTFNNLSDQDNMDASSFGRVTRDAVRAFRARLSLNVGSFIDAGNIFNFSGSAAEYYQQAFDDANALIQSGTYSFYDNYEDLWALANNSTNKNSEGIWGVNYSRTNYADINVDPEDYQRYFLEGEKPWDGRTGGHHGHMMWGMRYELYDGMIRDIQYGRRFRRYIPNKYLPDLYEETLDARFDGQFMLTWLGNAEDSTAYPRWADFDLPSGFTPPADEFVFRKGETSIVVTKEDLDDSRIAQKSDGTNRFLYVDGPYFVLDYDLLYNDDGTINLTGTDGRRLFLELSKFDDPERAAANGEGSERGIRDAYVFRLAEMYLIAAEASWKGASGGDAYSDFLLPLANSRAKAGATGAGVLSSYGINSSGDLSMDFFLDERAREFPGEQMRWFELRRVYNPSAWVARIQQYNQDTENLEEYHYFRPIPQVQLDALQDSDFPQNDGY